MFLSWHQIVIPFKFHADSINYNILICMIFQLDMAPLNTDTGKLALVNVITKANP